MKILIIEPFLVGSHKEWAENYCKHSQHNVKILSLPGRFWKWRMHGGAITLAKRINQLSFHPDLILATDMLNVPLFKSLININCPINIYFHENQLTYPWSPNDNDIQLQRDQHYAFINYSSALVANHNYFNSNFHLKSFISGLKKYLAPLPDYREKENITLIKNKSSVLDLGLDLKKFNKYRVPKKSNQVPIILWNHRWEHDKNPQDFFKVLKIISNNNLDFKLIVLGQEFKNEMKCFTEAKINLKKHIIQFGHVETFEEYAKFLFKADIIPITSKQDFFGISIMEAVYCNTIPILPNRLSYPLLYNINKNPSIFYNDQLELTDKLTHIIKNFNKVKTIDFKESLEYYDWLNIAKLYDLELQKRFN